jgi:hypothetical protein
MSSSKRTSSYRVRTHRRHHKRDLLLADDLSLRCEVIGHLGRIAGHEYFDFSPISNGLESATSEFRRRRFGLATSVHVCLD